MEMNTNQSARGVESAAVPNPTPGPLSRRHQASKPETSRGPKKARNAPQRKLKAGGVQPSHPSTLGDTQRVRSRPRQLLPAFEYNPTATFSVTNGNATGHGIIRPQWMHNYGRPASSAGSAQSGSNASIQYQTLQLNGIQAGSYGSLSHNHPHAPPRYSQGYQVNAFQQMVGRFGDYPQPPRPTLPYWHLPGSVLLPPPPFWPLGNPEIFFGPPQTQAYSQAIQTAPGSPGSRFASACQAKQIRVRPSAPGGTQPLVSAANPKARPVRRPKTRKLTSHAAIAAAASTTSGASSGSRRRRIVVAGLHPCPDLETAEEMLREIFAGFSISNVVVERIAESAAAFGRPDCRASVDLPTHEEAVRAVRALHMAEYSRGVLRLSLGDVVVSVEEFDGEMSEMWS